MKEVICRECGAAFRPKQPSQLFCQAQHRQAFNNRRNIRGVELYDLFMVMRYDREAAESEGVWNLMCRMAQAYRDEDKRDRAGRPSWDKVANVKARNIHLTAETLSTNALGIRR